MTGTVRHEYDKRVVRTKKAIKEALFRIMERKDISSITISELTAEADVNRRTFYTHYRCLTDVLDEIEGELVVAIKELAGRFDPSDLEKSVSDLFLGMDKLITQDFDYYFHLLRVDMRGMLLIRLKNVLSASADTMINLMVNKTDREAKAVSAFISGGFLCSYIDWHNNPNGISAERAARIAAAMVSACIEAAPNVIK